MVCVQAAEAALAQLRQELVTTQHACIELECCSLDEVYRRAVAAASAHTHAAASLTNDRSSDDGAEGASGEGELATLVRVLQHHAAESDEMLSRLKGRVHESADLEAKARRLLDESRRREAAAASRLATEAQRLSTLEQMRLTGTQRVHCARLC